MKEIANLDFVVYLAPMTILVNHADVVHSTDWDDGHIKQERRVQISKR